jgi:tRNA(fMet)-specific endonuclease VapC
VGSTHRKAYEQWPDDHLGPFDLLAITAETEVPHAKLCASVTRRGLTIPADDVWVAALAIQHGQPILSLDQRFDELPGVRRIGF